MHPMPSRLSLLLLPGAVAPKSPQGQQGPAPPSSQAPIIQLQGCHRSHLPGQQLSPSPHQARGHECQCPPVSGRREKELRWPTSQGTAAPLPATQRAHVLALLGVGHEGENMPRPLCCDCPWALRGEKRGEGRSEASLWLV